MRNDKTGEKKDSTVAETIINFTQRNRKGIFIFLGAVCVIFAGVVIFIYARDIANKKAIARIEEMESDFNDLRFSVNDENYAEEVQTLLDDLEAFGKSNKGLAASRAYSFAARIYSGREEWQKCEELWLKAAETGNKTYMGPIALSNVAAAAEEQGKIETAIEYLQKSVEHPFEFPAAPRAQFNIGRLYEKLGNNPAAVEAYRAVLIKWPDMQVWNSFARNAIIAIEVK